MLEKSKEDRNGERAEEAEKAIGYQTRQDPMILKISELF